MTLSLLMRRAGIRSSCAASVYRWANGEVEPKLSHFERVMVALEAQLAIEEDVLRLREARRLPEAAE